MEKMYWRINVAEEKFISRNMGSSSSQYHMVLFGKLVPGSIYSLTGGIICEYACYIKSLIVAQ